MVSSVKKSQFFDSMLNFLKELFLLGIQYLWKILQDQLLASILYQLKDEDTELIVIFKNSLVEESFEFDDKYTIIFDGVKRSRKIAYKIDVNDITTYILKRK